MAKAGVELGMSRKGCGWDCLGTCRKELRLQVAA